MCHVQSKSHHEPVGPSSDHIQGSNVVFGWRKKYCWRFASLSWESNRISKGLRALPRLLLATKVLLGLQFLNSGPEYFIEELGDQIWDGTPGFCRISPAFNELHENESSKGSIKPGSDPHLSLWQASSFPVCLVRRKDVFLCSSERLLDRFFRSHWGNLEGSFQIVICLLQRRSTFPCLVRGGCSVSLQ